MNIIYEWLHQIQSPPDLNTNICAHVKVDMVAPIQHVISLFSCGFITELLHMCSLGYLVMNLVIHQILRQSWWLFGDDFSLVINMVANLVKNLVKQQFCWYILWQILQQILWQICDKFGKSPNWMTNLGL